MKTRVLILCVVFLVSCTSETKYDKLVSYLEREHNYKLNPNIQAVAVITEKGGCMNCNKSFSDFISEKMGDPSVLFLVCSSGRMLDISFYLDNQTKENILLDQHDHFAETGLIEKSGVIFLSEEKIDTVVEISLDTQDNSFTFIHAKLNAH